MLGEILCTWHVGSYDFYHLQYMPLDPCAHLMLLSTPVNVFQAATRQDGLALLGVCDTFVLDGAHTQHLWHQPVELIKASPRSCRSAFISCSQSLGTIVDKCLIVSHHLLYSNEQHSRYTGTTACVESWQYTTDT